MALTFFLDFESRSRSPIKLVGGLNYVADPTTEPLCLCGSDGVRNYVWSPFPGPLRPIASDLPLVVEHGAYPSAIVEASEGRTCVAHNAEGFDRPLWEALGLPPRAWADTVPLARRAQLPGKLELLAERVLGVGKDKRGRSVTLAMSKPVALSRAAVDGAADAARQLIALGDAGPSPLTGVSEAGLGTLRLLAPEWWALPSGELRAFLASLVASPPYGAEVLRDPDPAQLTEIVRYCLKDVDLMRRICEKERLLEPHVDDDALEADRRINSRGVEVDLALVRALLREADRLTREAGERASAATGGEIGEAELRSTATLIRFLAKHGIDVEDTKSETVRPLLASATGDVLPIVLRARLDVARVSSGKLRKLLATVSADGRLRGAHAYYQAHTGRWAGRGMQTQNLPRAVRGMAPDTPERLVEGAKIERLLGDAKVSPAEATGSLIRQCFVGRPGLAVLDFKQIEARAVLYLAGDLAGMRRFDEGDPYLDLAERLFGQRVEKSDPRRQIAKVTILGSSYGAGPDALARYFAKNNVDPTRFGLEPAMLVEAWRSANPLIAGEETGREYTDGSGRLRKRRRGGYWKALEADAKAAVREPGANHGDWRMFPDGLTFWLPSNRHLLYRDAQVGPFEDRREALTYWNPSKRKRVSTYGGRLCENVTQAFARDFLAEGLVALESAGFATVLHTHDEFVVECSASDYDRVAAIVSSPPSWAPDFALGVDGHWSRRYAK